MLPNAHVSFYLGTLRKNYYIFVPYAFAHKYLDLCCRDEKRSFRAFMALYMVI